MKVVANQTEDWKMKMVCVFIVALGSVIWSSAAGAEVVEGVARAVTGDTIQVGTEVLFLNGIVAPAGEKKSRARLADFVAAHPLVCDIQSMTQGSHRTARCSSDGIDISSEMLRSGHAIAYPENGVDLIALQKAAREEGLGLWTSDKVDLLAAGLASGSAPPRDCAIKGNKSHKSPYDLRYHMLDTDYYSRTRINPQQGEKWFCTEGDAEAAGFGPAGR